ncbi:MAG TPA: hypothetical protein VIY49_23260 [Bryobacteraceae bacterium]
MLWARSQVSSADQKNHEIGMDQTWQPLYQHQMLDRGHAVDARISDPHRMVCSLRDQPLHQQVRPYFRIVQAVVLAPIARMEYAVPCCGGIGPRIPSSLIVTILLPATPGYSFGSTVKTYRPGRAHGTNMRGTGGKTIRKDIPKRISIA